MKEGGFRLCLDMVLVMVLPPPSPIVLLGPQLVRWGIDAVEK